MSDESARPEQKNEFVRAKDDFVRVVTKDPKKTSFYVCKVLELILCVIAIGLTIHSFDEMRIRRTFLRSFSNFEGIIVFTSLYGYILINIVLLVSQVLGEQLSKKMQMMFSGVASILCLTAGIILIVEQGNHMDDIIPTDYLEQLTPSGVFAILAAITFAVDTFLTRKYQ